MIEYSPEILRKISKNWEVLARQNNNDILKILIWIKSIYFIRARTSQFFWNFSEYLWTILYQYNIAPFRHLVVLNLIKNHDIYPSYYSLLKILRTDIYLLTNKYIQNVRDPTPRVLDKVTCNQVSEDECRTKCMNTCMEHLYYLKCDWLLLNINCDTNEIFLLVP